MFSRRSFLSVAAATPLVGFAAGRMASAEDSALSPLTGDAKPIAAEERRARIAKLQDLMGREKIAAFLVESGSSLDYFTGIRWWRSERTTAAIIPAKGEVVVVTPAFEEPSIRETLQVGGDVRPWNEHDSPFALLAQALKDRGASSGKLAIEGTTRFFITDGVKKSAPQVTIVPGDSLVRACRLIKSAAELALMQTANTVTLAAFRHAKGKIAPGMTGTEIVALIDGATKALGGKPEFSLALVNEATAYPHGSLQRQEVREGSTILVDCGCSVHGYQSDMSRSWVFGTPGAKQRKIWEIVKRGQEITLETAKIGVPVGTIDDAVRKFYEGEGFGPGYRLPGLPHRTGHGIGLDVHEAAYLVHGDATPLAPGMCFSDEPGLYIPGEFGIRLEDCWHVTESGGVPFTPLAKSIDDPV